VGHLHMRVAERQQLGSMGCGRHAANDHCALAVSAVLRPHRRRNRGRKRITFGQSIVVGRHAASRLVQPSSPGPASLPSAVQRAKIAHGDPAAIAGSAAATRVSSSAAGQHRRLRRVQHRQSR
jgi:hypothetical protein